MIVDELVMLALEEKVRFGLWDLACEHESGQGAL